ncbi:MAG TPA: oligosaccharide flippase family protein [archaeon]|nr:oligosaccharide flippase family protein [archaeon]
MSPVTIRSLVRETAVYGISGVMARSMGLLLLPVLVNFLSPEQFGHLKLTYLLVGLFQLIFVFGMGNSLVRYLIGAEDKQEIFSTHFWPLLAVSGCGSLAVWQGAETLAPIYFHESLPGDSLIIKLAAGVLWLDALNTLPYSLLRAEKRPFAYLAGITLSILVYGALVIYFLAFRKMGMNGVLLANVAGSGAVVLFFLPVFKNYLRLRFSSKLFGIYFAFGFPLIFSGLGKTLLDLADRWILERLIGAAVAGYYSAGYQVAAVANLAVSAFTLAWKPFLVRAAAEKDSGRVFSRVMTFSTVSLCALFLAVSFLADNLVRIRIFGFQLIKETFWSGLAVIPPVMVSYIFYGIYINLTVGCDLTGRTRYYAWTTGAAAVFNVSACFLLIPVWGMMGAAWVTLFSYMLQAILLFILTRKIYPVDYEWGKLARLALITAGCFAAGKAAGDKLLVEIFCLAAFCLLIFALRVIDLEVLKSILSISGKHSGKE